MSINHQVLSFQNKLYIINQTFFVSSKFSTQKLVGNIENFRYSGCTTDSGGGGTGHSLHQKMKEEDLCCPDISYLVGFCTLHTLQLTLANALEKTVGTGGLGKRNAVQLLHSIYDLQECMEFGLWKKEWNKAKDEVSVDGEANNFKFQKIPAPIITRWWTIGNAAQFLVHFATICRQVAENVRNWTGSGSSLTKATKIASGVISIMNEERIISDVKLIADFYSIFCAPHFSWMQKGDKKIGGTPGFLGRHMLSRYFLMYSCLDKLRDGGWKRVEEMVSFRNGLNDPGMDKFIEDPADGSRMTQRRFQEKKADVFFQAAFDSLEKHYSRYSEEFLFLSLYDERYVTKAVTSMLTREETGNPNGDAVFHSKAHNADINLREFNAFLQSKVNVGKQLENPHIIKCQDIFPHLLGEFSKL